MQNYIHAYSDTLVNREVRRQRVISAIKIKKQIKH